jgi:2-polyprenyl-6-hydroxyphenyl methylase/3-demethylubiquinone-9 3-methyltransferase
VSDRPTFEFGRNWAQFLDRHLNDAAIAEAVRCLALLLDTSDLSGRTFLDVGCGSGLSSLAARQLGAARVVSFDVDPESVECTRRLRAGQGDPEDWEVLEGSALDERFLDGLGTFDVVYSWGVLHHSGQMWRAVDLVSRRVAPGGALALAIYNRADAFGVYPDGRFGPSRVWVPLKRAYCALPRAVQWCVDSAAVLVFWIVNLLRLRNPLKAAREHVRLRGMELRTDIKDWLGGHPYEYASVGEMLRYLRERGFALENLLDHGGLRCNEYLFRR